MRKIIILYVPVIHKGYVDFLLKHISAEMLLLPDNDLIKEFTSLEREIRQINPNIAKSIISSSALFHQNVKVVNRPQIEELKNEKFIIITANDSISLGITNRYFPDHQKIVDTTFLRWDEKHVYSQKEVKYDRISTDEFDRKMLSIAKNENSKSSDWWRPLGAILVKNEEILIRSHSQHVPSEFTPYVFGDPRDFIQAGVKCEISSTLHAEETILLEAIRHNIPIANSDLYLSVFPCPKCAKFIAYSGIKRIFFESGHASLDGFEVLKSQNVELILIE